MTASNNNGCDVSSFASLVQGFLADRFESWGRVVARRPWTVLWGTTLFALACTMGVLNISSTGESSELWAVRERGYDSAQYMSTCCGDQPSVIFVYCTRVGDGSIFEREAVLEMLKIHTWVTTELQVKLAGGGSGGFTDVCEMAGDEGCASMRTFASMLGAVFGYNASRVPETDTGVLALVNFVNTFWPVEQVAAELTLDADSGLILSSRGLALRYNVESSADGKAFETAMNDISSGVATVADPSIIRVTHWSSEGLNLEQGRTVSKDIPLFIIALHLVVVFLCFTLGKSRSFRLSCTNDSSESVVCSKVAVPFPDAVKGRALLAWMGLAVVGLAAGGGIGIAALLGATFHSLVTLLPLIALGVQVDDCIITINTMEAYSETHKDSIEDRFARSLRDSGPCVTTTSLTAVVAFAIGISAAMPGVSYFCMYATSVFFFGWLFHITFFYACAVLDERRIERSKDCLTACIDVKSAIVASGDEESGGKKAADAPPTDGFSRALATYADWLLSPATALLVGLLFVAATVVACLLVGDTPVGLALEDILPVTAPALTLQPSPSLAAPTLPDSVRAFAHE